MERRTCKLCFRTFSNGRALGGHMRSHVIAQKAQEAENNSPSSSSSSASEGDKEQEQEQEQEQAQEQEINTNKSTSYGLREKPQRNLRFADPDFSFSIDAGSVVQDRESETESPRHNRTRSKRRIEPDTEPLSSVSDTTTEEDVALCLMMLSRDIWMRDYKTASDEESKEEQEREADEAEQEEEEEEEELKIIRYRYKKRSRFQCETCKKVFRSYQALGGHRASHKKIRGPQLPGEELDDQIADFDDRRKVHQCPVCYRVFSSGQALGGHKRSHGSVSPSDAAIAAITTTESPIKFGDNFIDLNLPAPIDDDETSPIEVSALSDADFVDLAK